MKGNIDYVLFAVREYYKDKATLNGEEIIIEPSFDPNRHVTIHGEVVQVPLSLSSKPVMIIKEHLGFPPYGPIGTIPTDYESNNLDTLYSSKVPPVHRIHDIEMDVQPGDVFVIATDVEKNRIYVGQGANHPGLYREGLKILPEEVHWIREDLAMKQGEERKFMARIRYRQELERATLYMRKEGLYIIFDDPQRGIASGQLAAWYLDGELLGSGVISA